MKIPKLNWIPNWKAGKEVPLWGFDDNPNWVVFSFFPFGVIYWLRKDK